MVRHEQKDKLRYLCVWDPWQTSFTQYGETLGDKTKKGVVIGPEPDLCLASLTYAFTLET